MESIDDGDEKVTFCSVNNKCIKQKKRFLKKVRHKVGGTRSGHMLLSFDPLKWLETEADLQTV